MEGERVLLREAVGAEGADDSSISLSLSLSFSLSPWAAHYGVQRVPFLIAGALERWPKCGVLLLAVRVYTLAILRFPVK